MALVDFYWPYSLSAKRFDKYLAQGWFRSGNTLYKTRIVCLEEDFHSPINIRVPLKGHQFPKSLRKVKNRNEKRFQTKVQPLRFIDSQRERLYQCHKHRFKGFVCHTLEEYLMGAYRTRIFDSYELTVWDQNRLIAWSCFDLGHKSAAGIMGLFDPEYDSNSLGNYTMIKEVEFLKEHDYEYYYPGYILEGSEDFNYKLKLGEIEYRQSNGYWKSWQGEYSEVSEASIFKEKTAEAMDFFAEYAIPVKQWIYPMHAFGYLEGHHRLLRAPLFIQFQPGKNENPQRILFYDIEAGAYKLVRVFKVPKIFLEGIQTPESPEGGPVWHKMLTVAGEIAVVRNIEEIKSYLEPDIFPPFGY